MKETKKTAIARKVNLNFQRVEKYLSYLEERGLIEYTNNGYKTTEKGKEFLHDYKKMKELFKRREISVNNCCFSLFIVFNERIFSQETEEYFDFFYRNIHN